MRHVLPCQKKRLIGIENWVFRVLLILRFDGYLRLVSHRWGRAVPRERAQALRLCNGGQGRWEAASSVGCAAAARGATVGAVTSRRGGASPVRGRTATTAAVAGRCAVGPGERCWSSHGAEKRRFSHVAGDKGSGRWTRSLGRSGLERTCRQWHGWLPIQSIRAVGR